MKLIYLYKKINNDKDFDQIKLSNIFISLTDPHETNEDNEFDSFLAAFKEKTGIDLENVQFYQNKLESKVLFAVWGLILRLLW